MPCHDDASAAAGQPRSKNRRPIIAALMRMNDLGVVLSNESNPAPYHLRFGGTAARKGGDAHAELPRARFPSASGRYGQRDVVA